MAFRNQLTRLSQLIVDQITGSRIIGAFFATDDPATNPKRIELGADPDAIGGTTKDEVRFYTGGAAESDYGSLRVGTAFAGLAPILVLRPSEFTTAHPRPEITIYGEASDHSSGSEIVLDADESGNMQLIAALIQLFATLATFSGGVTIDGDLGIGGNLSLTGVGAGNILTAGDIQSNGRLRMGSGGRYVSGEDWGVSNPAVAGGAGKATFNHGLGVVPTAVYVTLVQGAGAPATRILRADNSDFTSTTFKVEYRDDAGTLAANGVAPTTAWIARV